VKVKKCHSVGMFLIAAAVLIVFAPAAWSDGDSRSATQAEKDFYYLVMQTFAQAVPPGPAGWAMTEKTNLDELERVSVGAEQYPLSLSYKIVWQDAARKQAASAAVEQAGAKVLEKTMADSSVQEQTQKIEQLSQKMGAALERGDTVEAGRIQKELEILYQQLEKVYSAQDRELNKVRQAHEAHDAKAEVTISANSFSEDFLTPFSQATPVAGKQAFRTEGKDDSSYGWQEGITYVFLSGDWKLKGEGGPSGLEASPRPGLPHTKVQTLVVKVKADQARAQKILEGLDWKALEKLIKD